MSAKPYIVGIGGTTRANSSCEKALRCALVAAEGQGAETILLGAADLDMPNFAPERDERPPNALRLIAEVRRADAIIISSPGYHGGVSGLVKNAIDYLEDLRDADPPYLDRRAVGLIVSAAGWQATATTLVALRNVVHALRGWPTPLGVCVNTADPAFDGEGRCLSPSVQRQFDLLASQVMQFSCAFSGSHRAQAESDKSR